MNDLFTQAGWDFMTASANADSSLDQPTVPVGTPVTPVRKTTKAPVLVIEADGGSRGNPGPAAYGVVIKERSTMRVRAAFGDYIGIATNNVAEYSGLLAGVQAALTLRPDASLDIRLDSQLVIEQMTGGWKIKSPSLRVLATQVSAALEGVTASFRWVPRAANTRADALANQAMDARAFVGQRPPGPNSETA
ncbi:MAG: reverse transcriptase-like protein [Bifidobacteriaceae bacterium]|jgi:probable phosphoglycerate mutase|nr:reverse transcriptase-like protein [Bifidobacteriaceae bacterium]